MDRPEGEPPSGCLICDPLEPAELFHELLEHRYYLSMQRGTGVSTEEALADYIEHVLRHQRAEKHVDPDGEDVLTDDLA